MQLFDSIPRVEFRPMWYNESQFKYHNISARPPICAIRALLEDWFERFPSGAKDDLRGRFRSRINSDHRSAFFELYVHELLHRMGYQAVSHPLLDDVPTHPDFLVMRDSQPKFYMEVTATYTSKEEQAAEARIADMYDKVNDLDSPNFFLGIEPTGAPSESLPKRELNRKLHAWLRTLDPDAVLAECSSGRAYPSIELPFEGCRVTFEAIPKGPENRGRKGIRTVGTIIPEMVTTSANVAIRDAVSLKAKKYKKLPYPLIVAVNVMSEFCHEIDIMDGLMGTESVKATRQPDGTIKTIWNLRDPNGAWMGPDGARNSTASAAMVMANLSPWTISIDTPELIHNPWAKLPFDQRLWPLPQRVVLDNRIVRKEGKSGKALLGLPDPWPIPENGWN
ncbi:MAG: hypothetical protein ACLQVL_05040 [Terriglobia bacterium]